MSCWPFGLTESKTGRLHALVSLIPSARDPRQLAISVLAEIAANQPPR
jgi:xanthine/CO dehydrogenase XdhC/CoxF family maturation factor